MGAVLLLIMATGAWMIANWHIPGIPPKISEERVVRALDFNGVSEPVAKCMAPFIAAQMPGARFDDWARHSTFVVLENRFESGFNPIDNFQSFDDPLVVEILLEAFDQCAT
ncbi:MAG: hypothetical protein AAGK17_09780 [Pseudomonadota bacterium]